MARFFSNSDFAPSGFLRQRFLAPENIYHVVPTRIFTGRKRKTAGLEREPAVLSSFQNSPYIAWTGRSTSLPYLLLAICQKTGEVRGFPLH